MNSGHPPNLFVRPDDEARIFRSAALSFKLALLLAAVAADKAEGDSRRVRRLLAYVPREPCGVRLD